MINNSKKLKIIEVIQPIDGGSALHVRQLLVGLDKQRFTVHLAAANSPEYRQVCDRHNISYHQVSFTRSMNPLHNFRPWWQLWQLCHKEKYDVIHLHSTKAGLLGRFAAMFTPSKVIYTPHSPLYLQMKSKLARRLFLLAEQLTISLVDKVVLVSKSEREKVVDDGMVPSNKCEMIANGVDMPSQKYTPPRSPVVTMVSRLEKQKRQQDLIMAVPLVLKKYPQAKFNLIGGGSRHYELQSLIQDQGVDDSVSLMGPREDITEQFATSTLAVQCSETEGLPYVVLEAMAQGLPVIGTMVEGIVDLVEDGKTGLLYEKGDYLQLADKIVFLLNNPQRRKLYGETARRIVKEQYSLESMINSISNMYLTK